MHRIRVVAVGLLAAALLATPAPAQATSAVRSHAERGSGAPVAARAAVGARRSVDSPVPAGTPAPFRQDTRQNRAMMIVGGAALLTGTIIGHNTGLLISAGGAVVGLWGLFQFLQ